MRQSNIKTQYSNQNPKKIVELNNLVSARYQKRNNLTNQFESIKEVTSIEHDFRHVASKTQTLLKTFK